MRSVEIVASLYLLIGAVCAWGLRGGPASVGAAPAWQLPVIVALWPLFVPSLLLRADGGGPATGVEREGAALASALRAAAPGAPSGMEAGIVRVAEVAEALALRTARAQARAQAADPGPAPADPALAALHGARAEEHARLVAAAADEARRWAAARAELARLCARLERVAAPGGDEDDVDVVALHEELGRLHDGLALLAAPAPAA